MPFTKVPQATHKQGSNAVAKSSLEKIETAKKISTLDLLIIEQHITWENEQLKHELKYQRRKHSPSIYLLEEVRLVVNTL
jgi:hypothetical protein